MKYSIVTLGCKVNQYESEAISQDFKATGGIAVEGNGQADVCIINTCTVTQKAAMQSRQAIRQAIKANPDARIVVTGCYAQTEPDAIKKIDGVHAIIGHAGKYTIPDVVSTSLNKYPSPCPLILDSDIRKKEPFIETAHHVSGLRTRPFLKIQDGCDAFCSYCIVPFARGPSRSMRFDHVIENIKKIKDSGFHEIVLTGIHIGKYGVDLTRKSSLFKLLKLIDKEKLIDRLRISSIEPHELTQDMIQLVADSECICDHFHIPLQSGDDMILKKMKRPYTSGDFRELILTINRLMPNAAIGADILTGFPGETDKAFDNTLSLIHELPLTYLHVFPFSPRQGTLAYTLPGRIDPDVIKKRCKKLRDVGKIKKTVFYSGQTGKCAKLFIEEKRDRISGNLKGLTTNYIPVMVKGDDNLKNSIVNVRLEKVSGGSMVGSIT